MHCFSVISGHLQLSDWFLYLLPEGSRSVHSLRWGWLESLTGEQAPLWSKWSSQAVLVTLCRRLRFVTASLPYHSVMQLEKLLRIFGDEPNILSPAVGGVKCPGEVIADLSCSREWSSPWSCLCHHQTGRFFLIIRPALPLSAPLGSIWTFFCWQQLLEHWQICDQTHIDYLSGICVFSY